MSREGQGQIRGRVAQYDPLISSQIVPMPPEVIQVIGINTDPNCSRTMDPGMALAVAQAWTTFWLCVEAPATQIRMSLAVAQSLDINKSTGCGPNPRLPCDFWW